MERKNVFLSICRLLICSFLCMVLAVPSLSWAEEVQLTLEPASARAGDEVTISGTADPSTWVSIKILDEDGNIVYLNSIMSDKNGNYSDSFKVPDVDPGQLQVVAGYGSSVSPGSLTVKKRSSGKNNSSKSEQTSSSKPEKQEDGSVVVTPPEPEVDDETGKAKTEVSSEDLEEAFEKAESDSEGKKKVQIQIPSVENAKGYQVELPQKALETYLGSIIEIKTNIGTVALSGDMLENNTLGGRGNIILNFENVDKEDLTAYSKIDTETREKIGNRPIIEIAFTENGKTKSWENKDAPVTISIPYTLEPGEDPEHIVVWYIDGEGNPVAVPNGKYNTETGMVGFHVTHFSTYAVAYVEKTFDDLKNHSWAKNAVEVLASKGIINGTSNHTFSPTADITRADFLTLLVKTLELTAEFDSNFDDVKPGAYYYEPIGTAQKLGIAGGVGNNRFNPKESISRQDMMVMTERALKIVGKLSEKNDTSLLDKFKDKGKIAKYAADSIVILVKEGLIQGSGDMVNPLGNTTRAEAAVLMYRIYNK